MQFKNMNELVEYLGRLEERIKTLEAENKSLRAIQPRNENVDGNVIAKHVARYLPKTDLISTGFLKRAFAVWGHFFTANLIISFIGFLIYSCLMMVMFGSLLGSVAQGGG